ncbi:hypothetical protein B296_00050088 [Ensete ventricosum]|uniref:Uncharacterized protein n=1 Tax=Ensete ventricosum TaxID=4639 RepID=A0A426X2C6_ENSVE|nr:hypothetical protein B296_00050088 [Ensete ventricosum]
MAKPLAGMDGHGRPLAGAATHGQVGCKGSRLRPRLPARERLDAHRRSPAGATATRGHGQLWPAHRGDQLQGTRKGLPPAASPTVSRGGDAGRKGNRPLAGWLPTSKGNRDSGCEVRMKEG